MVKENEYLKPGKYAQSDDPKIKKLAERIIKGSKNEIDRVEKIFVWVRDKIKWYPTKIVGAKKLLERKEKHGLCTDKTNLFVALCRSVRIPTRYIMLDAELKTVDKRLPKRAKHIAAEIYVNGKWTLADPGFGQSTQKLLKVSQLGQPTWSSGRNIKRMVQLSRLWVFVINLYIRYSPFGRTVRKIVG